MEYTWTVDSAVWQIRHGGPTHRTRFAIDYLSDRIDESGVDMEEIALGLLNGLVEERGLAYLGTSVNPLPDETETVVQQVNENMDAIGDAVKNFRKLPR